MTERPFILIFTCTDPWNEISKVIIPDDVVVLSGLRGLKRKRGDKESLFVSEREFWISVNDEELEFEISHPLLKELNALPAPRLRGILGKDFVNLRRDEDLLFPLYLARVKEGFIFSPNKKLLEHFSEPESLYNIIALDSDFAAIQLKRKSPKRIKNIDQFISKIISELKLLKSKANLVILEKKGYLLEDTSLEIVTHRSLQNLNPQKTILIYDVSKDEIHEFRKKYYEIFLQLWPFPVVPLGYKYGFELFTEDEYNRFLELLKERLKI